MVRFSKSIFWISVFSITLATRSNAQDADQVTPPNTAAELRNLLPAEPTLLVGSKAPPLDIEHWISDGKGKFEPVTQFEKGKVYVVEFWATWCGPCREAMPQLSKLQTKYQDKNVIIVSISDEPLDVIDPFLAQPALGDKTYRDVTSVYCLTSDPDGSSSRDYMMAAGKRGIPASFLVGKDGFIEWMGHPGTIEGPLEQVLKGTWDREAFAAERKAEADVNRSLQKGDVDGALEIINRLIKNSKSDDAKYKFSHVKMQILVQTNQAIPVAFFESMVKAKKNDIKMIDSLGWFIYQHANQGAKISDQLIDAAISAVEKTLKVDPNFSSAMDTLARFAHLKGDLDKAIQLESKAIQLSSGRQKLAMSNFLKQLKEEKQSNQESPKEPKD